MVMSSRYSLPVLEPAEAFIPPGGPPGADMVDTICVSFAQLFSRGNLAPLTELW